MTAAALGGVGAVGTALAAPEVIEVAAVTVPLRAAAGPIEPADGPGPRTRSAALRGREVAAAAALRRAALAKPPAPAHASRALGRAPLAPREIAKVLLAKRGWSGQYSCLNSLWTKESNWRVSADNPTSSAYGIPQALPGSKMGSAGTDWRTNPVTQITWGLGYIADRYGTPCAAWSQSRSHSWY